MRVVKSPLTFFQKQPKMLFRNTIEFPHVTLCLVPKILDAVDVVLLVRKELGVVDPKVLEVRNIQRIVAFPAVGINDAVRNDLTLDDWHQGLGAGIGNDLRVDPSTTLQQPENRDFSSSAASPFAFTPAAKVGLVNFDLATENHVSLLLKSISDNLTQAVEVINSGLGINTDKGRRTSGRAASNKMFDQPTLLSLA